MKFVVYDDDAALVEIQTNLIRARGHRVCPIVITFKDDRENLKTVIAKIREFDPDFIIADQKFFDENTCGLTLLRRLGGKFNPKDNNPRIVASSSSPTADFEGAAGSVFRTKDFLTHREESKRYKSRDDFVRIIDELAQWFELEGSFRNIHR